MNLAIRRAQWVHGAALLAMVGLSLWAWAVLPPDAQVPIHWSATGEVDGTAGKALGLLLTPALSLAMLVAFTLVPAIEPRRRHLEASAGAYAVLWGATALLLAMIHAGVVAAAMGQDVPMARVMPAAIGLMMLAIAWVLPRVESNFMLGIRTPWTLSSERAWRETHAAGRWVFAAIGLAMIGLGLAGDGERTFALVIGGAVTASLGLVAYSYWVWRQEQAEAG